MKLTKFRVKNYKTIEDTGWIDSDQIGVLLELMNRVRPISLQPY